MPSWPQGATGSEHPKLSAQKVECPDARPQLRVGGIISPPLTGFGSLGAGRKDTQGQAAFR